MPVAPTYPGVYIEEIPSGVRTIVGVPTSIAAFLGRTISGPANEPVTINSFADFTRTFGGLSSDLPMGYAVYDFYQNGGGQAVVVRLYAAPAPAGGGAAPTGTDAGKASITLDGGLKLLAASPGSWGNSLSASVDTNNITGEIAAQLGLQQTDLFNLTISIQQNGKPAPAERFLNVTVNPNAALPAGKARLISNVLQQQSQLLKVEWTLKPDGTPDYSKVTAPKPTPPTSSSTTPKLSSGKSGTAKAVGADGETSPEATATGAHAGTHLTAPATATPPPVKGFTAPPDLGGKDSAPLADTDYLGLDPKKRSGLTSLDTVDIFNLLCIPPDSFVSDISTEVYQAAMEYCAKRRAMLLVDPLSGWSANPDNAADAVIRGLPGLSLTGESARNAALYFPRLIEANPLSKGQPMTMAPCGAVAGVMARTDVQRGVWKAPAGLDASLNNTLGLDVNLTNDENGQLNPLGVNCLRTFPVSGRVVWGARTLRGADQAADDYKYVPVRRLALFLEESLYRGTQWVVFEPNDAPLWASIRLNVGAFMHDLFRQGAFQGSTPAAAYFVKCDSTTTTQNDINLGVVNVVVGFAPLKPAEFVVLQIQQIAGDIQT